MARARWLAARASNGPVTVEYMAQALGVPLAPAAAGGTNYTVVGALTGTENFAAGTYGVPQIAGTGMLTQTGAYLAGPAADRAGTLFVVWGGAKICSSAPRLARSRQRSRTWRRS